LLSFSRYAQETPLAVAKAIQGLRAVFDETYPDPVRVVSVGVPVTDLIADPNSPAAFDYSVEFCGGTHLQNSSHMKKFVVLSEEAISKGVRRIIALTGTEALKAHRRADLLADQVNVLATHVANQLTDNKHALNVNALIKQIIELNNAVNAAQVSYWRKDAFRKQLEASKKSLAELDKANQAQLLATALDECHQFAAANPAATHVVKQFQCGSDPKSLNELLKVLKTELPEAALMLFSVDEVNEKILCLSAVPDVSFHPCSYNRFAHV
jgi:alanyl-tRNA synthetase